MSEQLRLFAPEDEPPSVRGATPSPALVSMAERLRGGLYLGTSSWSFPGWEGIVYDRKTTKAVLARHGLRAYAEHPLFRTVCIDRTYYAPIGSREFRSYARAVPNEFRFVVKAPELLTRARTRDGLSQRNARFLDPVYAREEVIGPLLEGLGEKAAVLLLQFPPQGLDPMGGASGFPERLHAFLSKLPARLSYGVELRNPELLTPRYLDVLRDVGTACHCLNVHPTMPPLEEQARLVGPASSGDLVVRWMLGRHRTYEDARDAFHPFDRLAEEAPAARNAIVERCLEALGAGRRAFVIVNNKAEGSAPLSLVKLAERLARGRGG